MPTRDTAPIGAPCWVDLSTSDTEHAREFYGAVFEWEAREPASEFGGYFSFTRDGVLVGGCMGATPEGPADMWSVYLATDDATKTVEAAASHGGQVAVPPMQVGELGTMAVVMDPSGAGIGMWQPAEHRGFGVLTEPGAPSWFELHTRRYEAAVPFYRDVFRWDTLAVGDTDEFRYTVQTLGEDYLAGIMDASAWLGEAPSHWSVYFGSANADATLEKILSLGGRIEQPAENTPYGRMATALDPMGARFKIIEDNRPAA